MNLVKEYSNKFNHLAKYASKIVNTEIRRIEKFVYELNLVAARDIMIVHNRPRFIVRP